MAMDRDSALSLMDDLDDMDREVTDWEADFLDSLKRQSDRFTWRPSPRQAQALEKMRSKYLEV